MHQKAPPDVYVGRKPLRDVNGASETRTRDLLHAMQALSQLSYGPGDFAEPLANSVTHLTALTVIRQPTLALNRGHSHGLLWLGRPLGIVRE